MGTASLSLVMIIRNEAQHLADCIHRVKDIVDEIVILDSGSTDQSISIAKSLGAKVYHSENWQGFGIQRQRAQSHANCDFVLVLDADERVTPDLKESITGVLNNPVNESEVYAFRRVNYFCGQPVHRHGWYRDSIVRLYSRTTYQYSDLEVHESVDTKDARVVDLKGNLAHHVCDDFYQFLQKNIRYSRDWAMERHKAGKKSSLLKCVVNSMFSFFREYILRGAMLGGTYGFMLAMGSAHYTFNKYLILLHMDNRS